MVQTDTISDMLTTIRNGFLVQKEKVETPFSKVKSNLLKVLQEEGYLKDYKVINETKTKKKIEITLSYIKEEGGPYKRDCETKAFKSGSDHYCLLYRKVENK